MKSFKGSKREELYDQLLLSLSQRFDNKSVVEGFVFTEEMEQIMARIKGGIKNWQPPPEGVPTFSEEDIRSAKETIARATKPGASGLDQILARVAKGVFGDAL